MTDETTASPSDVHDLTAIAQDLGARARTDAHGRAATVLIKDDLMRATVIALAAGGQLPEHNAPPAATLQCLSGEAVLRGESGSWELAPGSLVRIPPERHSVEARSDCVLLLSVAFRD